MSPEDVDVVRRFFDAYNARDVDAWAALVTSDFEFRSVFGRVYRGVESLGPYFDDLAEAWEEFSLEIEDIRDAGDERLVALIQVRARGSASKAEVGPRLAAIFHMRDRRISLIQPFTDQAEGLEAAGLEP